MRTIGERLPSVRAVFWLTTVWVLLWGDLSWGNVVNGVLLAVFLAVVFPLPHVAGLGAFRPLAVAVLVGRFAVDVVAGAVQVAALSLRHRPPNSAVIRVQLRSHSDIILATTEGLSSLIPGSVIVEVHRLTGVLYLHVLDVPPGDPLAGLDALRRRVLEQEERLMRAFSSAEELADAGFRPGWRVGSGDLPREVAP